MTLKPRFKKPSQKPDFDALIAFIKSSDDVAAIDEALLKASRNAPFYPDDKKLTAFFISTKYDEALDRKIRAAAAISAPLREKALIDARESDKDGAFTNFIYVDAENPMASKVYKVIRAPQIGSGTGGWGGLKEGDDLLISATVNREIYEEVIDAVRLLLNLEAGEQAQALEARFDACLKEANDKKEPLSAGVERFISSLSPRQHLTTKLRDLSDDARTKVEAFTAAANGLIEGLVDAEKQNLLQCRDDAHAINRGWGFKVNAYGHVAALSRETAEKFDALQTVIESMKADALKKGISAVAGEMQGIHVYTLKEAPHEVEKNHYGHEAFAEIAGFARLVKQAVPSFDTGALWKNFRDSGSVGTIARKMRVSMDCLEKNYRQIVDAPDNAGYTVITTADYAAAYKDKTMGGGQQPKI